MPNTKPVTDSAQQVQNIHGRAKTESPVHILQIGAITKGQEGKELADLSGMAEAGAPAFSEDGKSVMDICLYEKAMEEAARLDVPIFAHCEEKQLVGKGVLQKGAKAEALGVEGISHAVEDIITARDICLAKETGVRLHLCHCSTKGSVTMIREGKKAGVRLSAEVCPHHFTLTAEDIPGADTNYKMNPPLRNREDVEALKAGLREGTIEVIATDHAPHHADEKAASMAEAPFGIVGLETAASLTYTELVEPGILTPLQMAACMSYNPANVLQSDRGSLQEGHWADVVIFDPRAEYVIDKETFASMGKNTPFHGRKVKGKVRVTIVDGKIVYRA
jgi:dihydroorotase